MVNFLLKEYSHYEIIDYHALCNLICQINYGGRITDSNDQKLIDVTLKNFIHEDIFAPNYQFSECESYKLPGNLFIDHVLENIEAFPNPDDP